MAFSLAPPVGQLNTAMLSQAVGDCVIGAAKEWIDGPYLHFVALLPIHEGSGKMPASKGLSERNKKMA